MSDDKNRENVRVALGVGAVGAFAAVATLLIRSRSQSIDAVKFDVTPELEAELVAAGMPKPQSVKYEDTPFGKYQYREDLDAWTTEARSLSKRRAVKPSSAVATVTPAAAPRGAPEAAKEACSDFTPSKNDGKKCEVCGRPRSKHAERRDGLAILADAIMTLPCGFCGADIMHGEKHRPGYSCSRIAAVPEGLQEAILIEEQLRGAACEAYTPDTKAGHTRCEHCGKTRAKHSKEAQGGGTLARWAEIIKGMGSRASATHAADLREQQIARIRSDPRVEELSIEHGAAENHAESYFIYLKPGFRFGPQEHAVHEYTLEAALAALETVSVEES